MKQLVAGILAHVDAGKTTLSEALLFQSGRLKKLGRVDHRDAFLDTFALERSRGITIFSKQAVLPLEDMTLTLLDTPGHVDFSSEMERTLQVLDYAILVISGTDGIQAHTRTLWQLLEKYHIPVYIFINKMDLSHTDASALLEELRQGLDEHCVDFGQDTEGSVFWESIAMSDEAALNKYLETGALSDCDIANLIAGRGLFPCFFGSALKLDGVDTLLSALERYTAQPKYPDEFGARVFKVSRDPQGNRLTHLKVTGGVLKVKAPLSNYRDGAAEDKIWSEKADQLRIYSGAKFETVDQGTPGCICAVTGLSSTFPGQGLGCEPGGEPPVLEPVLTHRLILPDNWPAQLALPQLKQLEEEDPQLHISWNEQLKEINVQLMGTIQLEILKELITERFGMSVDFGEGSILYRETIASAVLGVGHFEPLRHYSEVHLLLEPGERGSGLCFDSAVSLDELDKNWQRLILTHLEEKKHLGVLTGSPITDMKITLIAGRAHLKHTEGGDFRESTYRAVRQGLMQAESILLEPWYSFRLALPAQHLGRAMSDLQRMSARSNPPELIADEAVLTGFVPVSQLRDYATELSAYTKGTGRLFCTHSGYEPCHNQEQIVEQIAYEPERDLENTPDSVFCAHGAGFTVKWDEVGDYMHLDSGWRAAAPTPEAGDEPKRASSANPAPSGSYAAMRAMDDELMAIYQRTYGAVKTADFNRNVSLRSEKNRSSESSRASSRAVDKRPEYLLVDGYNIIFAWDDLKAIASDNLDAARQLLIDTLVNYQSYRQNNVILVFDAYRVSRNLGELIPYHNIHIVYTKEAETADSYIEKASYELSKSYRVRVATSDYTQQLIIMGHGALRTSAREFQQEVEQVLGQISEIIRKNNSLGERYVLGDALRKAQEASDDK